MPERIQRKRTKGWRMPEDAIYVGRPTKWGNPFVVGPDEFYGQVDSPATATRLYRDWQLHPERWALRTAPDPLALRGRGLVCWCPLDSPCHADVLLELANGPKL